MNEKSERGADKVVGPNAYLTLHYRLALENDQDIVTTFGGRPATLQLGQGQLAPTLERALLGLREGERRTCRLTPEHAFGPRNPELLQHVSRAALRANALLEEGCQPGDPVEFNAPGGGRYAGILKTVGETSALFDFNHPLAGQTILFEVQLLGIL